MKPLDFSAVISPDDSDVSASDAARLVVSSSGMSMREVSRAMGKAPGYLSAAMHQSGWDSSRMGLSTFVRLAHACGASVSVEIDGRVVVLHA